MPFLALSAEQMDFCSTLEENMLVDALKYDSKCYVIDWSRARICKLTDRFIHVKWLGDKSKRKIARYSMDIAPFKSKVPDSDWEWRFELKAEELIDCPDDTIWYNSTIIEKEEVEKEDDDNTL
jgi:ubiquitin carboxyl-terminal hydrolase 34